MQRLGREPLQGRGLWDAAPAIAGIHLSCTSITLEEREQLLATQPGPLFGDRVAAVLDDAPRTPVATRAMIRWRTSSGLGPALRRNT
jgi:hypothetical protein